MTSASSAAAARVVIVEDYPVVRDGLTQLLNATPGITVVAAVGDAATARQRVGETKPDVVLLDLMLGGSDGLALIGELLDLAPTSRILILSMMQESVYAERAMRAGAVGYVMKTAETAEVVAALQTVLAGRIYLSPRIFVGMFRGQVNRDAFANLPGIGHLSDRELQVFQLIGTGLPNREIARQLGISVKTIETHRENLKNKLSIQDGAALREAAQTFIKSLVA